MFAPSKSLFGLPNHSKAVLVFLMICVLLVFWKDIILDSVHAISSSPISVENLYRTPNSLESIANRTLGFQEVFALALPDRKDRKMALVNAANATNITLNVLDAVRDEQIPQDKRPKTWSEGEHAYGELGCLRSHVMAWERVVKENINTALIIESDADWDMRIHEILPGIANASKAVAYWPFTATGHPRDFATEISPYGDNWDILWIGHCGTGLDGGNGRVYSIKDPTVPPENQEYTFAGKPERKQHPEGTRIVFEFSSTTCTSGYAISNQGARKMKKFLGESNKNIDIRMSNLCAQQPTLLCLSVWPQVITAAPSESNIKHKPGETAPGADVEDPSKDVTAGPSIKYSARRNAKIVHKGLGRDKWISEF